MAQMKIKRIRAGVYTFTNDLGFSGEILAQPEGGWTVYDPKVGAHGDTLDFFMHYSSAKNFAEVVPFDGRVTARGI